VAYAREGIERYLKSNEGQLPQPTSIAVLSDTGAQIAESFSKDGNALSDSLEHHEIGLRQITRSSEWGGAERLDICLKALEQLIQYVASTHEKTELIWISPGWPLISGPRMYLDTKQEQHIFDQIVTLSTQMRAIDLTLYNVNPVGVQESLQRSDYYEAFLKGVAKPSQAELGNLALQVLAVQSGGLAIESNSDVSGMIQRCVMDTQSWYSIGFDPLPADKQNEYHHIEMKVDQPGMVVRTRDGYYANPMTAPAH
jgi:VWFA-related protein